MLDGILRSLKTALATGAVFLVVEGVYVVAFCSPHAAWMRTHTGRHDIVMLRHPYGVPRAADVVYACERTHRVLGIPLHQDLAHYCAPAGVSAANLSSRFGGTCAAEATPADPPAYCNEHFDF
jgi:hypothetical protein